MWPIALQLEGVDMANAIGDGVIAVVRSHPNPDFNRRYNGITEITYKNIPQDVALYLDKSEQVRSAVAAGVTLPKEGISGLFSTFARGILLMGLVHVEDFRHIFNTVRSTMKQKHIVLDAQATQL